MKAARGKGHAGIAPVAQSGFTLVELLVAVSIATVVVLAAYMALTSGLTIYNRAGAASAEVQVVRALVDRLTRELEATYFNPQAPDAVFVGEEAEGTTGTSGSTGATSSMSGATGATSAAGSRAPGASSLGHSSLSVGTAAASAAGAGTGATSSAAASTAGARLAFVTAAGLSPLTQVEYFLQEPDPESGTVGGLYRQEKFLLDRQVGEVYVADTGSEGEAVLVAPEVVGFEVEYYDGQSLMTGGLGLQESLTGEDAWQTSWDAAAKGYLPEAVRVTFSLGSWPPSAGAREAGAAAGTGDGGLTAVRRVTFVVLVPLAQAQTSQQSGSGAQSGSSTQSGSGGQGGSGS
jgi:prepilin-type N-terminal cleavage/methylation domain-containing protein